VPQAGQRSAFLLLQGLAEGEALLGIMRLEEVKSAAVTYLTGMLLDQSILSRTLLQRPHLQQQEALAWMCVLQQCLLAFLNCRGSSSLEN